MESAAKQCRRPLAVHWIASSCRAALAAKGARLAIMPRQHTNIAEVSEGEALSIEHMVVHIIARGYHYNVAKRTFFAPERVEH